MDVKLPDGRILRGVPDGTTKAQLAAKLQANGFQVPADWLPPAKPEAPTTPPISDADFAEYQRITGFLGTKEQLQTDQAARVGQPRSAISKFSHAIVDMPGRLMAAGENLIDAGPSAIYKAPLAGPENLISMGSGMLATAGSILAPDSAGFRERFTYQPRTPLAQAMQQGAGAVMAPIGVGFEQGGKGIAALTGMDPSRGQAILETGAALVPGMKAAKGAPKAAIPMVARSPVEVARAANYRLRPSDVAKIDPEASVGGGKKLEKFALSNDLRKDLIAPNQVNTNRLVFEEMGLPKGTTRASPELFEEVSKPHRAVYGEVGLRAGKFAPSETLAAEFDSIATKSGLEPDIRVKIKDQVDQYRAESMNGPDTVKTISALRRRSQKQMRSEDVSVNDQGVANREIADALESELGRQLEARGADKLLGKFRNARVQLAKLHNAETALRAGQFDAAIFNRLSKKGVPLSGNLKVIADTAENFPWITKHPLTYADIGGAKNLGHETLYSEVKALPAAGLRKYLASDQYQNKLGKPAADLKQAAPQYFQQRAKSPSLARPAPAKVQIESTPDGEIVARTDNGHTIARKRGGMLQVIDTQTAKGAQGKGENYARIKELIDEAQRRALTYGSDTKVSSSAAKTYDRLALGGYKVKKNPSSLDAEGNWVSDSGRPVFEVTALPNKKGR